MPLLEGGPKCARLITTRDDQVLPREAERVSVDSMELVEAVAMLTRDLSAESQQLEYQTRLQNLAYRLGCWPLLLTLTHGILINQVDYGRPLAQALEIIEHTYEKNSVTAFHLDQAARRHSSVEACVAVSLNQLAGLPLARFQASQRYRELAVFPEDTDIPLAIVRLYWQQTGGLEPLEVDELCMRLHRLSLLLTCDLGKGTIRLHDVLRSYLRLQAGEHLSTWHVTLLDACQPLLNLEQWSEDSLERRYLWQRLIWHQEQAGHLAEAGQLLLDLRFLAGKALYGGVTELEADLARARAREPLWNMPTGGMLRHALKRHLPRWLAPLTDPEPSRLEFLQQSIVHLSHLLRLAPGPAGIGSLLLCHFSDEPAFAEQVLSLEKTLSRPYVAPWHPVPRRSSSWLLRTINNGFPVKDGVISQDGRVIVSLDLAETITIWDATSGVERLKISLYPITVNRCAISPDGTWLVACLASGALKIFDMVTGEERQTLSGHEQGVTCCSISPKGDWIVSGSFDRTLRIWDVASGEPRSILQGHTDTVITCAVSPDGQRIFSHANSAYDKVRVWDVTKGTMLLELPATYNCALSADGHLIVESTDNFGASTIHIRDATTGSERSSFKIPEGGLRDLAISPDNGLIALVTDTDKLTVWDAITGKELLKLSGHTNLIAGCVISPDGTWLLSYSYDGTLRIWKLANASQARRKKNREQVQSIERCAFSPDGTVLVTVQDKTLMIWDVARGAKRRELKGHTEPVTGCAISRDGGLLLSSSRDRTLKVWETATGTVRQTLRGRMPKINGCAISPDERFVVSACSDHTLKLWNIYPLMDRDERLTFTGHTAPVNQCAISHDMRFLISASDDHTLKIWDLQRGEELQTLLGHSARVNSCAAFPYGKELVSASDDCTLRIWDAESGTTTATLTGHTARVTDCAVWLGQSGVFIVSASADHTLKVWNARSGRELFTLSGHTAPVNSCSVSTDHKRLISASDDHTLKIWDASTGVELQTLKGHTTPVTGGLIIGTRDPLRIISVSEDGTYREWDPDTGKVKETRTGHTAAINRCAASTAPPILSLQPVVTASSDGTLRVWRRLGHNRDVIPGHISNISDCALSPDGHWAVAATEDGTMSLQEIATGSERLRIAGHAAKINRCVMSPDGCTLISASSDHTLKVWDTETGQEHLSLTGHTDSVEDCAFSPDGRFLLSASYDATLKIWNPHTGELIRTLSDQARMFNSCTFSPDGRWIISVSYFDKVLKVWQAQTGACLLTFPIDSLLNACAFHPDGEHLVVGSEAGLYFLRLVG